METKLKIEKIGGKEYYSDFNKNRAALIKKRLDEIAEKRLTQEKYQITDKDVLNRIQLTYKLLKRNTKEMTIAIANKYSENLGVIDKKSLNRGINLKNKYLKNKVIKIYEELNAISAFLRGTENTDYIFYYMDENGKYYRKHIKSEEIKKYYQINKNDAENFISSYRSAVERAFNQVDVIDDFSNHLSMFKMATESGLKLMNKKIENGQMGFLYEAFEWHLNILQDSFEEDSNGQIIRFNSRHNQQWFNEREINLAKSFLRSIGQKRWLAGGDVLNHQLKSSSTFGVSSLGQLEVSASMLFRFCDKILNNENNTINKEDIKNMVLFLNDIHMDVASNAVEEIDNKINNALDNMIKALNI